MRGFETIAVHGPRKEQNPKGALRGPLYDSVAFASDNAGDLEHVFTGKSPEPSYSRISNPTVEELEQRIQYLTDATGVVAVASGMAAITAVILTLAETGSNIITSKYLFGHSLSLFAKTMGRWGLETRFAAMTDPEAVIAAIDSRTRLIFLEVITNPQMEIADISIISKHAEQQGIPVVLDNTLATPYLFRSKEAGVAIEVISSTKYISGGATSVGGLVIDNGIFDWTRHPALDTLAARLGPGAFLFKLRCDTYRNTGACMAPHNAWLQILGLETLALRIQKSSTNALTIASFLERHPGVLQVNYPGSPLSPYNEIARKQFRNGFGGILTFDLGGKDQCFAFLDSLKLIRIATNLHDNKTLAIHPSSTIFSNFSAEEKAQMHITDGLIRLSAGIEDVHDLLKDLSQGLSAI